MTIFDNHNVSIHPDTKAVLYGIHPGHGIYWTINTVGPSFNPARTPKPSKDDITASRFAHVDIDPSPGWDKGAVLAVLIEAGATVVVDSGYGLQGLWAVVCPVPEVEAINRGLIARFGADRGTWNADRLFRVPGYTNYPNAKKRAEGRVASMAALLWSDGPEWTAEQLRELFPEPAPASPAAPEIALGPWQVETVESLALPLDLAGMVTTTGTDRSSHAMALAARLARAQYTNEQIMGLLMNPDYPWSGTIQDQADPERQAMRKVRDAAALRPDMEALFPPVSGGDVLPEPPLVTKSRDKGYRPRNGGVMLPEQQMDHFEGCVYVTALDKVLTPRGTRLTQSRFESVYGGHLFVITSDGQGTPSKSAWEAFIRNQRFFAPTADDMCFRPELEPLEIVDEGNLTLVNGYIPIDTPRTEGDAGPFLRHMEKLFPIERDRIILMSYMAFCLQNIGFKAQWWPVIQGAKGNGKTLFLNVMAYCIGEQYSHLPNTSKMTRSGINFNGWMRNKLFLGLDEIYSANRRDFLEEFKPYVTNRRLPIEAKGEDEFTGDNRANGIMLTNHKDGVPIDADERRYAPFFTRQQTAEDCAADGLTSEYFVDLWAWLRGEGHYAKHGQDYGFRIINWYLRQYVTSAEFDPAKLATRAPRTSSTEEAIKAGRGSIEQEIEDAIAEGRTGFAGPWVSGKALADLIDHSRIRVPKNKRRNLMQSIGYDWPKALPEGRPTSIVQPDGIRCVLYVKDGSPEAREKDPDVLVRAYTQAQLETKLGA